MVVVVLSHRNVCNEEPKSKLTYTQNCAIIFGSFIQFGILYTQCPFHSRINCLRNKLKVIFHNQKVNRDIIIMLTHIDRLKKMGRSYEDEEPVFCFLLMPTHSGQPGQLLLLLLT
jgi:hypothetical protein